jgi:hypothetical protein
MKKKSRSEPSQQSQTKTKKASVTVMTNSYSPLLFCWQLIVVGYNSVTLLTLSCCIQDAFTIRASSIQ